LTWTVGSGEKDMATRYLGWKAVTFTAVTAPSGSKKGSACLWKKC